MGRKPNTELRRGQIVEALRAELATVGYERATTKSIAARAGLAPGLVHYHFRSKLDILLALVEGLIIEADRRFAEALAAGGSPKERLTAYVESRVGLGSGADTGQVGAWINIIAETTAQERVRTRLARWLSRDHDQLARLFAEAGVREPAEHAALLLAMILGSFSLHALRVTGVPRGYAERRIVGWLDAVAARRRTGAS